MFRQTSGAGPVESGRFWSMWPMLVGALSGAASHLQC